MHSYYRDDPDLGRCFILNRIWQVLSVPLQRY